MKRFWLTPALCYALTIGLQAQESTNQVSSGLQIKERTQEERIQFLLDVAQVYFAEDNFDDAMSAYERVLKIDPENQQARFIIGHVYISAKQYAKAVAQLTGLAEDFPDDFQVLNNLAWLYATADDPAYRDGEKAVELAQKAMVLAPNDHHIWSTLSEAYYMSGEYEKAYRAITHMAQLAARYGKNLTKESVEDYNQQILKCKRALDTQKMLESDDDE